MATAQEKNDSEKTGGLQPTGFLLAPEMTAEAEAFATSAREEAAAWRSAYGHLVDRVRTFAQHLLGLRQCFRKSDGSIDWYGNSNAYQTMLNASIYVPVFGERPDQKKDPQGYAAWRRDSGFGSFQSTLSRVMQDTLAQAEADGIKPTTTEKTTGGRTRKPTALRVISDASLELAKNTGASEVPDVPAVLRMALANARLAGDVVTQTAPYGNAKVSAPATIRKLVAQVQAELNRITASVGIEAEKKQKAEKNSNRNGRTGTRAA